MLNEGRDFYGQNSMKRLEEIEEIKKKWFWNNKWNNADKPIKNADEQRRIAEKAADQEKIINLFTEFLKVQKGTDEQRKAFLEFC